MGLKVHLEDRIHVERDGAQVMRVEVHPKGDQYHVEMIAVQNPLGFHSVTREEIE